MSKKIRVGVLFGGKSAEHEVSLQSAKNVIDAIDKEKYEVVPIGINKEGKWLLGETNDLLLNSDNPKLIKLSKLSNGVVLVPQSDGQISSLTMHQTGTSVDVIFPVLHGPFGEDGTVQGLLKLAHVPFVGASVLGSAIGMDKDVMKRLLRDAEIPIAKFLVFRANDDISFEKTSRELGMPMFVKPANLGSSVGVSKVKNKEEFENAIYEAFQYDSKILVEETIVGREIECSVLGNENPIASVPGEILPSHEFYSYKAKYIDENGATLKIPANVSDEVKKKIQELAIKTFRVLECEGLGRVDFFLKEDGNLVVVEINTIPGFTKISMYPRLWQESGVSYTDLIDRLIQLAIERFKREQKLKTQFVLGD
ncbi:MAG: D-alanine--D-alanine ligase [Minisyncoccota bacterium]